MILTVYAKNPDRWVRIYRPHPSYKNNQPVLENIITGYKIVLDTNKKVYDSYVQTYGGTVLLHYTIKKPVSDNQIIDFWEEFSNGELTLSSN